MTAQPIDTTPELPCHRCGYDLRAHPADAKCPECGTLVVESQEFAKIPRRPAWRDADPRWRRRMVAGVWILLFLPLMDLLETLRWSRIIPVPSVFDFRGTMIWLHDTMIVSHSWYESLVFSIGVVLLFSKERGRHRNRFDWTRRWGVLCSYVVLLLHVSGTFFIWSLVLVGVAAIFHSIPLAFQPGSTRLFAELSTGYLYYGPQPNRYADFVAIAFSSVVFLLACAPLYEALRSNGAKWAVLILLAPLALFAVLHLLLLGAHMLGADIADSMASSVYFSPGILIDNLYNGFTPQRSPLDLLTEASKWCIILVIALWLTMAQFKARRR